MPKKIPVVAWDHIVVRVTNLERSLAFYTEHLGFDPVADVEIGGEQLERILSGHAGEPVVGARARLVLGKVGGQLVELIQYAADGDVELPAPGIGAFTLRVSDADEAYEAAVEGGLDPETKPIEIEGSKQFFITDPDGVNIELTQPPKAGGAS
jgi:catechol 2,3-dioxygenase-like lactoylglutathione lyase family enzyme